MSATDQDIIAIAESMQSLAATVGELQGRVHQLAAKAYTNASKVATLKLRVHELEHPQPTGAAPCTTPPDPSTETPCANHSTASTET